MSNSAQAAIWMMGAMLSFTLMAIGGRSLTGHLDTFEIMMYRSLLGLVVVVSIASYYGSLNQVSAHKFSLHMLRNVSHFMGQNLWFYAVGLIPLSQLFAFEFTTPLWVTLLAPLVLGERWTKTRLLACGVGFFGILVVANPDTISISGATLAAALCAIGFAGTVLATKILSRTETITCILFWLVALQFLFGLLCAGLDGDIAGLNSYTFPWALLVGFCGLMAHFCITRALSLAPATVVTPLEFLRLPLISIVGFFLYNEPLIITVFLGTALILVANIMNIMAESRAKPGF